VRVVLATLVPLAAALLQGSVVPFIAVAGARPNLVVLAAASWGVAVGAREAVWWAFLGGLAADLLSGGPLGAMAIAALVPVSALALTEGERERSLITGAVLVGVASLVSGLLYLLILGLTGAGASEPAPLVAAAVGGGVYNGVLAIATYPLCRGLRRTTEKQASFGW